MAAVTATPFPLLGVLGQSPPCKETMSVSGPSASAVFSGVTEMPAAEMVARRPSELGDGSRGGGFRHYKIYDLPWN